MKSKERSQPTGSPETSAEDAFSGEWFARYLLDAVVLVVLVLMAIGIGLYLSRGAYLRDWSKEPGAGFLACLLLCPMLGILTLVLVVYAGVRLFQRPRSLGHAFIRLTLLVAHVSVLLVWTDTISSTVTALAGSVTASSSWSDPTENWRAIADRDFSGSPGDGREGTPNASSFSPPSGMGAPGLIPGGGPSSR
jgi:hypothetical protein